MRMLQPALGAGLGIAVLMLVSSGCGPAPTAAAPAPPEVTVATPEVRDVTEDFFFTGKTASADEVELRARVKGFLETADFQDGQFVERGQVLFTIEREPFEAALAAAEAQKRQTEARVKLAEADLARADRLTESKAITVEEYQSRVAKRDAAKAQLAHDEAEIRRAQINLDYTAIRSPIAGRVSRRQVDPGNLVGAGESTLLATVVGMDPMYVYFDVSEKVVMDLVRSAGEDGDRSFGETHDAYVQMPGEEDYPHRGNLDYLDNRVDPGTGTAVVRAVFPNDDGLLYPGVYARVRVPGPRIENAVLIEEQAIGTDLDGKYVLVVKPDNVVEQRRVTLGARTEGLIVVRDGLNADERYIVAGVQHARPGMPVRPVERPRQAGSVRRRGEP